MTRDTRDDILAQIAAGKEKRTRVQELVNSLPAWSTTSFKNDQADFNANYKLFQESDPIVMSIETRLLMEQGPVWRDFTPEERTAFYNWTTSLEKLEGYVNKYFPTEQQQRIMEYILWGIAVGSFVLPMLLVEDGKPELPFKLGPLPLPPGIKPKLPAPPGAGIPRAAYRPSTPQARPTFSPASFSKIPAATTPSGAIPVKAEIMRPATASAPWRSSIPAPASGNLPSPGFRSFVKPLGPSTSVTPETATATVTGAPVRQTATFTPGIPPKPRFGK